MGELIAVLLFIILLVWLFALAATPVAVVAAPTAPAASSAPSSAGNTTTAAAVAAPAASRPATYVVQPGDTLYRIARRYGITLPALLAANSEITNANLIRPGQTIRIP